MCRARSATSSQGTCRARSSSPPDTGVIAAALQSQIRRPWDPRGVMREPVELVAAVPADVRPTRRMAIDPVCQMAVDPEPASDRRVFDDTAYFLCTLSCTGDFAPHLDCVRSS